MAIRYTMAISQSISSQDSSNFDPVKQNLLLKAVIQRSLSGILIFQEDRVIFSNPALQKIVGLTEEELLWTNPFDLVHPVDLKRVRRKAKRLLKGLASPDDYEFRILTAEGKTRWVHLLATSIIFRGRPAVLANILDIEERKQAEELQRETHRLQTTLLDTLPHPAMLVRQDRIILAANRPALDLGARVGQACSRGFGQRALGTASASADQRRPGDRTVTGYIKCTFCLADQAMKERQPLSSRALEAFGGLWDLFWIPVDKDTYLHYAVNVTEQRKIEKAIRESEERYRLITDTMNDGLSIQNREGVITQVNRRLCDITGFTRRELIGRPLADLFVKKKEGSLRIETAQGDRPGPDPETFIRHKDGRRIEVSLKIESLIDDQGNHKGNFTFFSDITELKMLRRHTLTSDEFENIVGHTSSMRKLYTEIIEVAACDLPILIQGESGVGKELVAQAIHNRSHRKEEMFVPVNCAALPEGLLESELFGHIKGAFTGAIRDKKGRFELARGGTIFLDEIGELSVAMQVKLLRILEEGTFERVGDHRTTKVDVRVISATNKDLEREMNAGRFRRDLFYRLCVIPILVPPLRDRKKDIPLLADHFISAFTNRESGPNPSLSHEALRLLMTYDWPGNVRELKNAIYSASVKSKGDTIQPLHLPTAIGSQAFKTVHRRKRRRKMDQSSLQDALRRTGGNKLQAARLLGVNRSTLYRFLAATDQEEN